ncbi:hypothetical protein QR685DRAFT_532256 [Neurospora intermedia]|uniref:Uncharacterized protein n=1 Tax=Neurospora intermedia TaxID=5142 RepID=A0ABR3D880_NEUIN
MSVEKNPKEEGENESRPVGCHGAQGLGPSPEGGHESGIALRRRPNSAAGIQPLSLRPGLFLSAFFEWGGDCQEEEVEGGRSAKVPSMRETKSLATCTAFG